MRDVLIPIVPAVRRPTSDMANTYVDSVSGVLSARLNDGSVVTLGGGGGGGAPTTADYLVRTANGSLSAERVVTDTATITWDWSTAGQAKASAVLGSGGALAYADTSTFGRSLIDDADAATARTTLGAVGTARSILTLSPLSGGGDLSADRTLSLIANGITDSYLRQGAGTSVIGRSAGTTGNVADIAATADGQVLTRSSGALVWAAPADLSTVLTSASTIAANACRTVGPNYTIDTGDLTIAGDLVVGG
ncbi:hypothetical protein [Janthinobacterium sp.]|uniref:hypothetical protein n=1 Tax=Janthinobacterium sp. TaxID=1871054 RepID=UPI0025B9C5BC|nr:hypothetical protein [Janthinobacterium sp.]NBV19944.1 hypothetical protein [Janthinobacterium sp.]